MWRMSGTSAPREDPVLLGNTRGSHNHFLDRGRDRPARGARAGPLPAQAGQPAHLPQGQVHAAMAKERVLPATKEMFGPAGQAQLDAMALAEAYVVRVESLRAAIELYDREVA